jgi:hypothetical protein
VVAWFRRGGDGGRGAAPAGDAPAGEAPAGEAPAGEAPVILGAPHRPHRRAQANHAQLALAGIAPEPEDFWYREDFLLA